MDTVYTQLATELYRYALYKLKDQESAEDAVQETFVRLLSSKQKWEGKDMKRWSIGILRNVVYERYRELAKQSDSNLEQADSVSLEDSQITMELSGELKQGLTALEAETKEIIILKTWEELKFEEIAEIMKLNTNTVKAKYYRGIDELKENLNRSQNESGTKNKKVRSISTPILLAAIAELAKASEFQPSPQFLENLENQLGSNVNLINSNTSMNKQLLKSKKVLAALAAVALIVVAGLVFITTQLTRQPATQPEQVPPVSVMPTEPVVAPDPYKGWLDCRNEALNISMMIPADWTCHSSISPYGDGAAALGTNADQAGMPQFDIVNLGRGPNCMLCKPGENLFSNDIVELWYLVEDGKVQDITGPISIVSDNGYSDTTLYLRFGTPTKREPTAEEKVTIIKVLESMKAI